MTDVQKSPMNLLKEALKFGGFREETFECENVNGERRLVPPFVTSMTAGTLSLTIEFGEEVKSKNQAKRITYDVLLKNMYPEEYELAYEDSAEYAEVAATEIPKAHLLKAKRESTVHHERVYKRMCEDIEKKIKDEEKRAKILERKKAGFEERMEATTRNRFPTWEELDTIEDPEKVWFARMMKASRAFNLDIDWDFEFDFNDKENKKVTCTVQVHQKKEGEEEPTFLFKLDHSAELGEGKEDDSDRIKGKGEFVRQIKGQLSEDIVNQLVTEGIAEDVDECATKILMERSEAFVEARLNETEEEREERIKKAKEERKNNPKKDVKKGPKTMRQKLKERREKAAKAKDDKKAEKSKKKALEEKIAAKKEKLKAKAKAKRDAKKGKKTEADAEEAKPKGKKGAPAKKGGAPKKESEAPKPRGGQKTKAELRKFYLETVKKVSANDKLSEDKKKKLCDKYKKIYNEKVDALKTAPRDNKPAPRNNDRRGARNSSPPRRDNRRDSRRDDDRRRPSDRDSRDTRGGKRERRDDYDSRRQPKQAHYQQQPMYMQPVMMPQQMYAPPPSQAYQPQQVQGRGASNAQSQIATLQAQQQAQMAQLQAQLQSQMQSYQQPPAPRHPQQAGGRPQQGGRRW